MSDDCRSITPFVCALDRTLTACHAVGRGALHVAPFSALAFVLLLVSTTITAIHVPFVGYVYSGNGVFAATWPLFLAVGGMCVGACWVSASVWMSHRYGPNWRQICHEWRRRVNPQ